MQSTNSATDLQIKYYIFILPVILFQVVYMVQISAHKLIL
jgi:hypothetical protein